MPDFTGRKNRCCANDGFGSRSRRIKVTAQAAQGLARLVSKSNPHHTGDFISRLAQSTTVKSSNLTDTPTRRSIICGPKCISDVRRLRDVCVVLATPAGIPTPDTRDRSFATILCVPKLRLSRCLRDQRAKEMLSSIFSSRTYEQTCALRRCRFKAHTSSYRTCCILLMTRDEEQ